MDRIELTGLKIFGYHGVYDHEKTNGQNFIVDVVLWLDTRVAAATDSVDDTVDYAWVAQCAFDIIGSASRNLIETVAAATANKIMEDGRVQAVEVTVHKPQAPIPLDFQDVAVVVRRSRHKDTS